RDGGDRKHLGHERKTRCPPLDPASNDDCILRIEAGEPRESDAEGGTHGRIDWPRWFGGLERPLRSAAPYSTFARHETCSAEGKRFRRVKRRLVNKPTSQ